MSDGWRHSILSNIDSIQEFKVLTYNYSAEYGTRAGPTVLLTTKSGTNNFHGSLYEFFRNTDLDAKSFFATSTEKFNLNQFGGSIGGPIRKNKTFFFVDGEQKYLRRGITFTGLVPSLAMRNGDFSADPFGQTIPGATLPNPNMVGAVGSAALFRCDALGNPLPVNADGSQAGAQRVPDPRRNAQRSVSSQRFDRSDRAGHDESLPCAECKRPKRRY
jgi:hypothetical protein